MSVLNVSRKVTKRAGNYIAMSLLTLNAFMECSRFTLDDEYRRGKILKKQMFRKLLTVGVIFVSH